MRRFKSFNTPNFSILKMTTRRQKRNAVENLVSGKLEPVTVNFIRNLAEEQAPSPSSKYPKLQNEKRGVVKASSFRREIMSDHTKT